MILRIRHGKTSIPTYVAIRGTAIVLPAEKSRPSGYGTLEGGLHLSAASLQIALFF
jgi:hypothetical protein